MKKLLVAFLFLLSLQTTAQKTFREGYILLKEDTVRGLVQYREGNAAIEKCSFKKDLQQEVVTYTPAELNAYGFDTRHFRSVLFRHTPVFAEVIVDGKAKLLRQNEIYLVQKDTAIISLQPIVHEMYFKDRKYETDDKTFARRLTSTLTDCPTLPREWETMRLSALTPSQIEKTFSTIVTRYNRCIDPTYTESTKTYDLPKTKKAISWGVYAGITKPSASISSTIVDLHNTPFSAPVAFTGGVFIDYINPRISEKLHLTLGLGYTKTKLTGSYASMFPTATNTLSATYSALKVPVSISYHFSAGNFSPYVRFGANGYFIQSDGLIRTTHYETSGLPDRTTTELSLSSNVVNLFAGLGLENKAWGKHFYFVEFRYESRINILGKYMNHEFAVGYIDAVVGLRF